jgi:CHAT domain-containing protein/Tfp pilus assembly protein PilF
MTRPVRDGEGEMFSIDPRGVSRFFKTALVAAFFWAVISFLPGWLQPRVNAESHAISVSTNTQSNAGVVPNTAVALARPAASNWLPNQGPSQTDKAVAEEAFGEARRLVDEGSVESLRRAIAKFDEALRFYRAIGDSKRQGEILNDMGFVYDDLGERQRALGFYNQALIFRRASGDGRGEATTLSNIGAVYSALGDNQKALEFYGPALDLRRRERDRSGEAITLSNIGTVYHDLGENQNALEFYNKALPLQIAEGDRLGQALTLNNIGAVCSELGDIERALEFHHRALTLQSSGHDRRSYAGTLNNIGYIYSNLGEKPKALEFYSRALGFFTAVGDVSGRAATLNNIGAVYSDLGNNQKAAEFYRQALPLRRAVEDHDGEAATLNNLGLAYSGLGDKQKALDFCNQALRAYRAVGDRDGEATALSNIGLVYETLAQIQKAIGFYQQALPLFRAVKNRAGEAKTLGNLRYVWRNRNPGLAVFFGKLAVNLLQELRFNITDLERDLQKTFLRYKLGGYRYLAELLINQNRLPEAQQVLNSFKDQQFFDFNRESQKRPTPLTLTPREAFVAGRYEQATKQVEITEQQLNELKRKLGQGHPNADETLQLQPLESRFKTATRDFLAVIKEAETDFRQPPSATDKVGEIADSHELQTALRELSQQTGENAVAVYTLVAADQFFALIVTSNSITSVSQPVKAGTLNKKALQLWALLQSDRYDPAPLAQELYSIIFKPIEMQLPRDTKTILWSLDDNLRYLPMGVLYDGKQYLIGRYQHVVFTRADRERLLRSVTPRWTGLGLSSSQARTVELLGDQISFKALPGVNEELRVIFHQNGTTGVVDGDVLPDEKFTKAAMLTALKQKRPLVHIASHFSFRPGDEARSFLLLGDGSTMTLAEMKQQTDLFAGVQLLTLSACNTAAQQPDANGREIDGFAELAQRLGAASVMATLWPVADNSTPWLMREFYQSRQNGKGLTKVEALRTAQLGLLDGTAETRPLPEGQKGASSPVKIVFTPGEAKRGNDGTRANLVFVAEKDAPLFKSDDKKPFAHPYYWAPFILIGNWK